MNKKFVARLLSVALAMTMVLGSSLTALADGAPDAHPNGKEDHEFELDTSIGENGCGWGGSDDQHFQRCKYCLGSINVGTHDTYTSNSNGTHNVSCTICNMWGTNKSYTESCTFNSEGRCTKCNYFDSSKSDQAAKEAAIAAAEKAAKERAEAIEAAAEAAIKAEEELPVASFVSTEALNSVPAEAKGSDDTTYNISTVTTTRGFVAAVNKIAKDVASNNEVSVYSKESFAFNEDSLNAVASTGKDFVYTFTYKGHLYKITIPAGAKVNTNGQIFMGPLAIGAQLGTTEILK